MARILLYAWLLKIIDKNWNTIFSIFIIIVISIIGYMVTISNIVR